MSKPDIVEQLATLDPEVLRGILATMSTEDKRELLQLMDTRQAMRSTRKLYAYRPYPKQREFHAAGATKRERLFLAGNQLGKTLSGANEWAMHLTGDYPDWWTGRRIAWAGRYLAGSESRELTVKGVQRLLLGPPEDDALWGTGAIPKDRIVSIDRASGVANAVASVSVRHVTGELSVCVFASYDQGRTKWQADTLDGVWLDEEPPLDIYSEALTRTNATGGFVMVTCTPLLGMTEVVKRFLDAEAGDQPLGGRATVGLDPGMDPFGGVKPDCVTVHMTIEDAEHYSPEQRALIIASYPEHEREARANGIPMRGSGLVFPIAESGIKVEPFPIPSHWRRLVGLDFGWDHPAAAVWLAYDADTDVLYVYDCWRGRHTSVALQAVTIRSAGSWIPVAWPHDGYQHDKGSGEELAKQYREAGVAMHSTHATFPPGADGKPGGYGFEAGISEMMLRFQTRRLRVFSHLSQWFQEYRNYHRENGQVVKKDDDILSATRIGMMMKRIGITEVEAKGPDVFGFGGSGALVPAQRPLDAVMGY